MNGTALKAHGSDGFEIPRGRMVAHLRSHYKITDERVLDAMNRVPRHAFVPEALRAQAYKDNALPISSGQTISQPFIVARMTELLELKGRERVLEIGSGSGYQTGILAAVARKVFAVERIATLHSEAKAKLMQLGFRNISYRCDDGTKGWEAYAPFDAILVAAGGPEIPEPLVRQLEIGGRMVIPIGSDQKTQMLVRITRTDKGFDTEDFGPCAFVPLIGSHGWKDKKTLRSK
jgi:protein-L-isoaspartate(D-aspartate) O-methyltransferase